MRSEQWVERRIATLTARAAKLKSVWESPDPMGAHFSHGVGRMTERQARGRRAMNDRKAKAFKDWQATESELKEWKRRLSGFRAGECWLDGQPRKDAPSRVAREKAVADYGAWMRGQLKVGMRVLYLPVDIEARVKRVNQKTVTLDKWNEERVPFIDVLPWPDGEEKPKMVQWVKKYSAWEKEQASADDSSGVGPAEAGAAADVSGD